MKRVVTSPQKYIGISGEEAPLFGLLEGELLHSLWDAGERLSSVDLFEMIYLTYRVEKQEMPSPSTISVTLSRMVDKGLLTVERQPRGGKCYYQPTRTRAPMVAAVLNETSHRLVGQSLGYVLSCLTNQEAVQDETLAPLLHELKRLEKEEGKPLPLPEWPSGPAG